MVQAGLVVGHAEPGSRVSLDGRRVRVARDGTFLIGFAMDAPETMTLEIVRPDGSHEGKIFQVEQREYAIEEINDLPADEVDLDRPTRVALQRAHRRIVEVRRHFTPRAGLTASFEWPVEGRVSTPFGVGRVLNGEPRSGHDAIDLAVPIGTAVHAPAAGVVAFTSEAVPLSGRIVILDHGMGLTSTFLHLSEIRVSLGESVERGDTIALSGDTGRTTGPNLHWGLHLDGVALDAALLFPPTNVR